MREKKKKRSKELQRGKRKEQLLIEMKKNSQQTNRQNIIQFKELQKGKKKRSVVDKNEEEQLADESLKDYPMQRIRGKRRLVL